MPNTDYRAATTYVLATTAYEYAFWAVRVEGSAESLGFIHVISSTNISLFNLSYVGDFFLHFKATTISGGDVLCIS